MKITGLSRVSKDMIIKEVERELKKRSTFFVTQHTNVSANAMDKLRAKLRQSKSRYLAVKNRLGKKAFEHSEFKSFSENMTGACGIAFTDGDGVLSSKTLIDFSKENEGFKVTAGYSNGQVMTVEQVKTLASLPSREVLIAKVLGGMQAPIVGLARTLSGTLRKIVTVLDAIAKKKGSN